MSVLTGAWRVLVLATLVLATLVLAPAGAAGVASPSPVSSQAPACRSLAPGDHAISLDVGGVPREVLVHVPAAATPPGGRLPLVTAFHGYSAYAWQLAESARLGELADADGFVVAYPQGAGPVPAWWFPGVPDAPPSGTDDLRLVEALLGLADAEGCIDMGRVVVMGHSMGGGMANAATCAFADRLAGAVLVSAVQLGAPCEPAKPIPIVALHAVDDEVLPYAGGRIAGTPAGYPEQLPVEQEVARWAARDGCAPGPPTAQASGDGAVLAWQGCTAPVVLHRLATGGHDYSPLGSRLARDLALGALPGVDGPPR